MGDCTETEMLARVEKLTEENKKLKNTTTDLLAKVQKLESRVSVLEGSPVRS